jgi:hypothetical protein
MMDALLLLQCDQYADLSGRHTVGKFVDLQNCFGCSDLITVRADTAV